LLTRVRTEAIFSLVFSLFKNIWSFLQGIKSVFGGIKNYLFARNNGLPAPQQQSGGGQMSQSNSDVAISSSRMNQHHYQPDNDFRQLDTLQEEQNHPGLRQRGLIEQDHSTGKADVLRVVLPIPVLPRLGSVAGPVIQATGKSTFEFLEKIFSRRTQSSYVEHLILT
jgi:hypothetical protein